jgi:hypothetical protein
MKKVCVWQNSKSIKGKFGKEKRAYEYDQKISDDRDDDCLSRSISVRQRLREVWPSKQ